MNMWHVAAFYAIDKGEAVRFEKDEFEAFTLRSCRSSPPAVHFEAHSFLSQQAAPNTGSLALRKGGMLNATYITLNVRFSEFPTAAQGREPTIATSRTEPFPVIEALTLSVKLRLSYHKW